MEAFHGYWTWHGQIPSSSASYSLPPYTAHVFHPILPAASSVPVKRTGEGQAAVKTIPRGYFSAAASHGRRRTRRVQEEEGQNARGGNMLFLSAVRVTVTPSRRSLSSSSDRRRPSLTTR